MRRIDSVLLLASLMVGCATDTQTFDVSVKNRSSRTVTLVLTKTGGPVEDRWASPEQIINRQTQARAIDDFQVVVAGRTAIVHGLQGQFPAGAHAVLRVYAGNPTLGEMLKIFPGNARVDMPLSPGGNYLEVRDSPMGVTVSRQ